MVDKHRRVTKARHHKYANKKRLTNSCKQNEMGALEIVIEWEEE